MSSELRLVHAWFLQFTLSSWMDILLGNHAEYSFVLLLVRGWNGKEAEEEQTQISGPSEPQKKSQGVEKKTEHYIASVCVKYTKISFKMFKKCLIRRSVIKNGLKYYTVHRFDTAVSFIIDICEISALSEETVSEEEDLEKAQSRKSRSKRVSDRAATLILSNVCGNNVSEAERSRNDKERLRKGNKFVGIYWTFKTAECFRKTRRLGSGKTDRAGNRARIRRKAAAVIRPPPANGETSLRKNKFVSVIET